MSASMNKSYVRTKGVVRMHDCLELGTKVVECLHVVVGVQASR